MLAPPASDALREHHVGEQAPPCSRSRRHRPAPWSGPTYVASLIGACLHTPQLEQAQQRSSCGNSRRPVAPVDARWSAAATPSSAATSSHVEAEAVGHDRHLGAGGVQRVDAAAAASGSSGTSSATARSARLVVREQVPLVEEALAAADLAAAVLRVDLAPLGGARRSSRWTPVSTVRDRPVEVEEHRRARRSRSSTCDTERSVP